MAGMCSPVLCLVKIGKRATNAVHIRDLNLTFMGPRSPLETPGAVTFHGCSCSCSSRPDVRFFRQLPCSKHSDESADGHFVEGVVFFLELLQLQLEGYDLSVV